jgi:hypothetical protein
MSRSYGASVRRSGAADNRLVLVRHLKLGVTALATLIVLAGCSSKSEPSSAERSSPPPTSTSADWGSYPPDTSLDEREVVEAYVHALNARDGARFCSLMVPWISGRFDIYGTDPEASLSHPVRCPAFVAGFIGHIEDCCPPEFVSAEVSDVGDLDRRGDVVGVPVTITLTQKDSSSADAAPYEEPLQDVVWLTQESGAWRVAKLSQVAAAASLALPTDTDYDVPPDVDTDRRAFAAEAAKATRQQREYKQSFRPIVDDATCPRAARYPDGQNDVVDHRQSAPPTPTPQLAAADIRAVETYSKGGRVCTVFEMAGDVRGGSTFTLSHESPNADWTTTGRGFAQFFEVELREDMHARVTSGRDPTGRALSVPATTGVDGRRLMLVLDESSFAAGRASPSGTETSRLLPRFRFIASATVDLNERRSLHDDLGPGPPTGTVRFEYPPR